MLGIALDRHDVALEFRHGGRFALGDRDRVLVHLFLGLARSQDTDDKRHLRRLVLAADVLDEGDHVVLVVRLEVFVELVVETLEPDKAGDLISGGRVIGGVILLQVVEHLMHRLVHQAIELTGLVHGEGSGFAGFRRCLGFAQILLRILVGGLHLFLVGRQVGFVLLLVLRERFDSSFVLLQSLFRLGLGLRILGGALEVGPRRRAEIIIQRLAAPRGLDEQDRAVDLFRKREAKAVFGADLACTAAETDAQFPGVPVVVRNGIDVDPVGDGARLGHILLIGLQRGLHRCRLGFRGCLFGGVRHGLDLLVTAPAGQLVELLRQRQRLVIPLLGELRILPEDQVSERLVLGAVRIEQGGRRVPVGMADHVGLSGQNEDLQFPRCGLRGLDTDTACEQCTRD